VDAFVLVAAILAGITAFGLILWGTLCRLFLTLSGWNRLAGKYPAPRPLPPWNWTGQTVRVGSVRYRRCMRISAQPDGLYLAEGGLLRHPALRLPWSELHSPSRCNVYGRPAIRLSIGRQPDTTVEFPLELYHAIWTPRPGAEQPAFRA
jgi:hypothetical protein